MFDKEIVMLIGEGLLAGGYLLWLISGITNSVFHTKVWSWKKMFTDIAKAILMGLVLLGLVALADGLDWYAGLLGYDISTFTDGASTTMMLGGIVAGIATYYGRAVKNALNFFKLPTDVKPTEGSEQNYHQIVEDAKDFLDTMTYKSDKEQLLEDGAPEELFEDVEISEEDAGRGGIENTYPEPYRSKPQDSIFDPSGCYNRECVSYCAWKIYELTGKWLVKYASMNARNWAQRLAENGYTKVVDKPLAGGKYVGVSEAGLYGHVVWAEEGDIISEYNYVIPGGFSVRQINTSAYKWVEIKAPEYTEEEQEAIEEAESAATEVNKKTGVVTYTYKQGDTFGQVIKDLGLETEHGLWGNSGDVAYYTEQLHEQGIWGNVPIGTTIKLTPRK